MDSKTYRSLTEAAIEVRMNQFAQQPVEETVEETVEEATGTEELVYEYLSSFLGVDLNESIDELTEEQLEEAIAAINVLANAVNEYFEIDENMYLAPKGKGRSAAKKLYK